MKSSDLIASTGQNIKNLLPAAHAKIVAENIVCFILGLFISKGVTFGAYAPFGSAFLAAVPYNNMLFSFLGVIIGYILPSEINIGIRYVSTAVAICTIRWTLNDLPKVKASKLFAPILSFAGIITTGFAVNIFSITDFNEVAMYLSEAILSGSAAYFFSETANILSSRSRIISQPDFVCVCMTAFMVILSLLPVNLGYISVGKVFAILAIMLCAKHLGVVGGSIAGTTAGVLLGLAFKEPTHIMGAYAFGGLIAGFVSCFGKMACCLAFLSSCMVISSQAGDPTVIISGIYEVLAASLIFLFLRDDIGEKFTNFFAASTNYEQDQSFKKVVTMRLNSASQALINISGTINSVAENLAKVNSHKNRDIYTAAVDKVCSSCGLRSFCFDSKTADTLSSFSKINEVLCEKGKISPSDLPSSFAQRCTRATELTGNINLLYGEMSKTKIAESRVAQVRDFVSEQFCDVGLLLSDIGAGVRNCGTFDPKLAQEIITKLKKLGLAPLDVCCRYDEYGRISVEIEVAGAIDKGKLEKMNLAKRLSRICKKKLSDPAITATLNTCKIQLVEKPTFNVQVKIAQHICKNGVLCGDNYTYFNDGAGRMVVILSDGMGTGGRAAIEGAMACKVMEDLIKAGMTLPTAVKITNSVLRVKSEDEFLSTLDILCVDLFTGAAKLIKAGAPLTLIKKCENVIRLAPDSLPIGILKDVNIAEHTDTLAANDKILMVSDGAVSQSDKWLEDTLKTWDNQEPQQIADSIVKKILKNQSDDFDDDITVIAIKLADSP